MHNSSNTASKTVSRPAALSSALACVVKVEGGTTDCKSILKTVIKLLNILIISWAKQSCLFLYIYIYFYTSAHITTKEEKWLAWVKRDSWKTYIFTITKFISQIYPLHQLEIPSPPMPQGRPIQSKAAILNFAKGYISALARIILRAKHFSLFESKVRLV